MNAQISEEAAEWFVGFRTATLDVRTRRRFDAWIRTSPEHLRAYLEFAAIWEEGQLLDRERKLDPGVLVRRVEEEGNIIALPMRLPEAPQSHRAKSSHHLRFGIAAAAAMVAIGAGGWHVLDGRTIYATDVAEQRSISLEDGTAVALNARSKIKVRFTSAGRNIELLDGQALFQVAKDARRPFVVRSDNTSVRAIGTQFDIDHRSSGTVVTVLEGRVAVSSQQPHAETASADEVLLSAGEQASVVEAGFVEKRTRVNLAVVTAWTQRQLVFEAATLQEIAREFNRHSLRRFIVDPSAPADLRLSGVFSTTDLDLLVRFLRERPGIEVRESGDEILISQVNK